MTETKYINNVVIDGSRDITQLTVEGHSTQTEPLQKWQDSGQEVLAQVAGNGRLQIGNDLEDTSPTALLEVHREAASGTEPVSGVSTRAKLSGEVSRVLEWVVHKLELLGASGVSQRVAALRVQLRHNNSGPSASAELRGGDFEVVNQSGSAATPVGEAVGVRAAVSNEANANLSRGIGVQIDLQDEGTLTHAYGLKIEDVTDATYNYAIQTGQGDVEFGGDVEVKGQLTAQPFSADVAGLVPDPGTASGRYLKDDGSWGMIPLSPWTKTGNDLHYSSGNIGIGTTLPDGHLHVFSGSGGTITPNINADDLVIENSTNAGISILAPDASNTNLIFGSPSDAVGALIQWNYAAGRFHIGPHTPGAELVLASGNNVEAMRIDKDGNIGVGEAPDSNYKLDVAGAGRISGAVNIGGRLTLQPENQGGIEGAHIALKGAGGTHPDWHIDTVRNHLRFFNRAPGESQVDIFSDGPNASTNLVVGGNIHASGNIGVGKPPASAYKLDVAGAGRISGAVNIGGRLTLQPENQGGIKGAHIALKGAGGTHPDWHIDTVRNHLRFFNRAPGESQVDIFSDGPNASTNLVVGGNIHASGNVGVGKPPASAYKLDVAGAGRISGAVNIGGRLTLQPENQGGIEGAHIALKGAGGTHPDWHIDTVRNHLRFFNRAPGESQVDIFSDGPNASTNLVVGGNIHASGNVGVGKPPDSNYKLDVAGAARIRGAIYAQTQGSGDVLFVGNDAKVVDINVSHMLGVQSQTVPTQGAIKLGSTGGFISGKNGNIGIGKSPDSPYKLDVAGAAHFAGNLTANGVSIGRDPYPRRHLRGRKAIWFGPGEHDFVLWWGNGQTVLNAPLNGKIAMQHQGSHHLVVTSEGKVGIGNAEPSQKLDVAGTIRANDYIEYSDMYVGDALAAIKSIRPEADDGPSDLTPPTGWTAVDHETLPVGVKVTIQEEHYVNKRTGEQLEINKLPDQTENPEEWQKRSQETLGRSVGAGVQLNLRAIQQLIERVERLEARDQ